MRERFSKKFDGAFLFVHLRKLKTMLTLEKQVSAELMILAVAIKLFINV